MPHAYLLLGSNQAPAVNLPAAVALLREQGRVLAASPVYESPDTREGGPPYLNAAVLYETTLAPAALKTGVLKAIERQLGHARGAGQTVAIDIDIMLWADSGALRVMQFGERPWRVPHPEALTQPYAARPLADLAPEQVHPEDGRTLAAIAAALDTSALVRREDVAL